MKQIKVILMLCAMVLGACGGGGAETSGLSAFNMGFAVPIQPVAYSVSVEIQRAGASTTQISSTEIVQVIATVSSNGGGAVEGVVVTFSQSAAALITFAPAAATSLTNSQGKATINIIATNPLIVGAITVQAVAQVGLVSVTSSKSVQISAAAIAVPSASSNPAFISFIGSVPKGTAIAIKGAGGNGRSESAILTFRVVDAGNSPVVAIIDFNLNVDSGGATIVGSKSATSNPDGYVNVTVASGAEPAAIVVVATARVAGSATTQSDTLIVSNSIVVDGHFEIVADKYNIDGSLTGDEARISAFVSDKFGNLVADGLAVSFQTDNGAVASSVLGGCLTVNGTCNVQFRVQNPRGDGIATVRASVRVSKDTTLSTQLKINMAGVTRSGRTPFLLLQSKGDYAQVFELGSCKQIFELKLSDGNLRATPVGTTVSTYSFDGSVTSIKTGSPVRDQRDLDFPPTDLSLEVDLTGASVVPACRAGGTVAEGAAFYVLMKSSGGFVHTQRIALAYPQ